MLPEVRGQLTSMTNHKINQHLKAFCHRHRRIRLALIHFKEPQLALLLLILMDEVFNSELTHTLCRRCINWKRRNLTFDFCLVTLQVHLWNKLVRMSCVYHFSWGWHHHHVPLCKVPKRCVPLRLQISNSPRISVFVTLFCLHLLSWNHKPFYLFCPNERLFAVLS